MALAENERSVETLLDGHEREADCRTLVAMMERVTGERPKMWGAGIVGFGSYHYVYESGHEGDSCLTGFAPRKGNLTIYVMPGFESFADELGRLGKHKTGKGCLYVKRLADVDETALEDLLRKSVAAIRARYP